MKRFIFYLCLITLVIPLFDASAQEGGLLLTSSRGVYQLNKPFTVWFSIDSGGDKGINASESIIKYDPKYFKINKVSIAGTVMKLWVKKPTLSSKEATVTFAGGMPNTNTLKSTFGKVFEMEVVPIKYGKGEIKIGTSSVLIADGTGRDILKRKREGKYTIGTLKAATDASNLTKKLSGKILLQVQQNGEAWYVYPIDLRRYYLGRPSDAFAIMRKLGLGVQHSYITKYTIFPKPVIGKVLIDVEDSGKAYYINPKDKKAYYLGRPADAFRIMREKSVGITDETLDRIKDWAI